MGNGNQIAPFDCLYMAPAVLGMLFQIFEDGNLTFEDVDSSIEFAANKFFPKLPFSYFSLAVFSEIIKDFIKN